MRWYKALLSFGAVFHLFAIFVLPNPESMLYRAAAPLFINYGNFLGINTTWRFFSPNPLMRYMEYTVFYRDAENRLQSQVYRHPRHFTEEPYFENYSRKLNNAMYVMNNRDFLNGYFSKMICRWHPEAEVISLSARGRVLPNIEKSKFIEGGRSELGEVQTLAIMDVQCGSKQNTNYSEIEELTAPPQVEPVNPSNPENSNPENSINKTSSDEGDNG